MDTSNPAVFVNAETMRMYVGRRVRAVIQVLRNDGGSITGKSTDEQQLVVKGHPPSPLTTFIEVIGIADSNQSIQAEIWTNFGDNFGMLKFWMFVGYSYLLLRNRVFVICSAILFLFCFLFHSLFIWQLILGDNWLFCLMLLLISVDLWEYFKWKTLCPQFTVVLSVILKEM